MVSSQIIQTSIEELSDITGTFIRVTDTEGHVIASAGKPAEMDVGLIREFVESSADTMTIGDDLLYRIPDDTGRVYVLQVSTGDSAAVSGTDPHMVGRIASSHLKTLISAFRDKQDRGSFIQNLLLDNMLRIDILSRAKKLHIDTAAPRVVLVAETRKGEDSIASEFLSGMFGGGRDYVTAVEEQNVIVVKELSDNSTSEDMDRVARMIADTLNTEALINVRVSYGNTVRELADLSRSYKEARLALNVGSIFYPTDRVVSYDRLGIGRLIYQLPENLCRMFIDEVFGDMDTPMDLDEETRNTIDMFFANNLNVSETARQLFVHRNTLVYRIEKIEKSTGLDIRNFDDAMIFKISMMVLNYIRHVENL